MTQTNGHRPPSSPQLTFNVTLLSEFDQRSLLVMTSQLDAILALLSFGLLEVTS